MQLISEQESLVWISRGLGWAVFLQALEMWMIRSYWSDHGVWRWKILQAEFRAFSGNFQKVIALLLDYPIFSKLVLLQAIVALSLIFIPSCYLTFVLCGLVLLNLLRWRGTFNGGSDFMTVVVLTSVSVGLEFQGNHRVVRGCLCYIAVQACASYFVAGWAKLKSRNWISGRALMSFIQNAVYENQNVVEYGIRQPNLVRVLSWGVLVFECSFPLALFTPQGCLTYLMIGGVFHLGNIYLFGLNRFFWIWISTYPALYYWSHHLG